MAAKRAIKQCLHFIKIYLVEFLHRKSYYNWYLGHLFTHPTLSSIVHLNLFWGSQPKSSDFNQRTKKWSIDQNQSGELKHSIHIHRFAEFRHTHNIHTHHTTKRHSIIHLVNRIVFHKGGTNDRGMCSVRITFDFMFEK